MADKLTFVHLTDLHVHDPATPDSSLHSDTNATLRAILAEVARVQPAPAFIVVSGDLTNLGDAASYLQVKAMFGEARLAAPVLFALGNHDSRPAFYRALLGRETDLEAPYDHDALFGALHVIVLDTSVSGRVGGGLADSQFDWLAGRLAARPDLQRLLVMHHGPMLDPDNADSEWEAITAADTARLHALLAGHDNIVGILSGHIHYDRVSSWYGIPIVSGIGQHAATDVLFLEQGLRILSGASFVVGTVRPSGLTVAFAPQPSDRHELAVITNERLAAMDRERSG